MKTIVSMLIALVVVVGAGWYLWSKMSSGIAVPAATPDQSAQATTTPQQPSGPSLTSGSSDANLNADLSQLDASVDSSASASQSAQSFSDQPVQQSY